MDEKNIENIEEEKTVKPTQKKQSNPDAHFEFPNVMREHRVRKMYRLIIVIIILFSLAIFYWNFSAPINENSHLYREKLMTVSLTVSMIFTMFYFFYWKCSNCNKSLGLKWNPKFCLYCSAKLR